MGHDAKVLGDAADESQVMRDQQDRQGTGALVRQQNPDEVVVGGIVDLGRRFVQDQHLGAAGQRQRQQAALVLAAAQGEGVGAQDAPRVGELQAGEQLLQLGVADAAALADLPADGQDGVEAGGGVLRSVKYAAAADAVPGTGGGQRTPAEEHSAAADAKIPGQEAGQGPGQQGLAGPGFPEQHRDLAGGDLQVDAAQYGQGPAGDDIINPEIFRAQHARLAAEDGGVQSAMAATASISTAAPRGSSATATAARAG